MKGSRLRAALPLTVLLIAVAGAWPAFAQTDAVVTVPADRPEELEPRAVGAAGMMSVGFAGFVDRFNSTQTLYSTNYTAQVDVERFLTRRIAIRFGLLGTGREHYEFVTSASSNSLSAVGCTVGISFDVWYDLPSLREEALVTVTMSFTDHDGLIPSKSVEVKVAP